MALALLVRLAYPYPVGVAARTKSARAEERFSTCTIRCDPAAHITIVIVCEASSSHACLAPDNHTGTSIYDLDHTSMIYFLEVSGNHARVMGGVSPSQGRENQLFWPMRAGFCHGYRLGSHRAPPRCLKS